LWQRFRDVSWAEFEEVYKILGITFEEVRGESAYESDLARVMKELTDKGLVVQGNRAAANISTRTNLAASTTDTTINFMIAEDSSAPYLITTARGPMSSPSLNVTRGSAKDPPGMVNTLTNGISGGVQQAPSIIPKVPVPNIPIPNIFGR